ncbi:MAG: transglutaminase family protein [Candidatus Thorarchaeota archaeon]
MRITNQIFKLQKGPQGIKQTLALMSGLKDVGKKTVPIRQTALSLVSHLPQKDFKNEVYKIFSFVQNNIRYVKDVHNVETLQTPVNTLLFKQGDCDDKSVLLASLLESIGHKTRFKAIGLAPNKYSHVYVQVFVNGKWVSLDATEPNQLGWEAPFYNNVLYG